MDWFEMMCYHILLTEVIPPSSNVDRFRRECWGVYMLMRRFARENHFEEYPYSKKKLKGPFKKRKLRKQR